jgi:hypothetical protein
MKTRLFQSLLAVSALVLLGGCDTEQAATTCRAAGGGLPFASKYLPVGAAAPADSACASPGNLLALSSYDPPEAVRPSVAIAIYDADFPTYPTTGNPAIAVGEFTEKQSNPATSTCSAPTLSPLTGGTTTYAFSNLEVYVSAANQGTQLKADLTISDSADACSAQYKVLGLWPEVPCESNTDCGEGSGINPDLFESVACDASIGFCMLTGNDFVKTGGDN